MAVVKFGKQQFNNVIALELKDHKTNVTESGYIELLHNNGAVEKIKFSKDNLKLRIEQHGNLNNLHASNCATVVGNIEEAIVGNCLNVEGFVVNYKCTRDSIKLSKDIKILCGLQAEKVYKQYYRADKRRTRIIHIEGDINKLKTDISNIQLKTDIIGSVNKAIVDNTLGVKGIVKNCSVGNIIECTLRQ